MPAEKYDDLMIEAEEALLGSAPTLSKLSDECAAAVRDYFDEVVDVDGRVATRAEQCDYPGFKASFWQRVAWTGYRAFQAALRRHDEALERGEEIAEMGQMELSDLLSGIDVTSKISRSRGCWPVDVPDD